MNDYDKLVARDANGTFCILFQNRHSLEMEEIEQIFSQFGKVFNIKSAGDARGYRFVRYKFFDEAEKAIKGLKDHPTIKLAHHRSKNKTNQENQDTIASTKENTNDNNFAGKKQFNKNPNNNKKYQKENNEYEKNASQSISDAEETNSIRSRRNSIRSSFSARNSFSNEEQNLDACPNLGNRNGMKHTKPPSSLKNGAIRKSFGDKIPDRITRSGKIVNENNVPKKIILNAEEVIVGNIPPNFGASYILHLLDSFEPVAISKINVVPKRDTRYCHVYFKSLQDSMGAERKFDQMHLSGQKLVVLRTCRLMEEAIS